MKTMKSTIAQKYIREQIETYERIRASFPALSLDDHFLGYDLVNSVRETLAVLRDVRDEIKAAQTYGEVQATLLELYKIYREEGVMDVEDNARAVSILSSIYNAIIDLYAAEACILD